MKKILKMICLLSLFSFSSAANNIEAYFQVELQDRLLWPGDVEVLSVTNDQLGQYHVFLEVTSYGDTREAECWFTQELNYNRCTVNWFRH